MENSLRLLADSQEIEIKITDLAWCKCWVRDGTSRIYLGAESFKYIRSHLLHRLADKPDKIAGKLNGKEVYWILSLAEAHHVLYFANNDKDKILFWQNEQGKTISEIQLPAETLKQWFIQLKELKVDEKSNF